MAEVAQTVLKLAPEVGRRASRGAERGSLPEHFEEVALAAMPLVFHTALEGEVTEFLERKRYRRTRAGIPP